MLRLVTQYIPACVDMFGDEVKNESISHFHFAYDSLEMYTQEGMISHD